MLEKRVKRVFSRIPTRMTRRLTLRAMKPIDSYDMFEYACRSDVTKYLTWRGNIRGIILNSSESATVTASSTIGRLSGVPTGNIAKR